MDNDTLLKFVPFESSVDSGFWWHLSRKKLDVFGLDETPVDIVAAYENGLQSGLPSRINLDYSAFDRERKLGKRCEVWGKLYGKNTVEGFKECDKGALIGEMGKLIWDDIKSGAAVKNPELLGRFLLLTYVDLKKYHFYYWFAFPALLHPLDINLRSRKWLREILSPALLAAFALSFDEFATLSPKLYFAVHVSDESVSVHTLEEFPRILLESGGQAYLGFSDPSCFEEHPGWPLRNLLALASHQWKGQDCFNVICLRDRTKDGLQNFGDSPVLEVTFSDTGSIEPEMPGVVGWEKNEKRKRAPRRVDLSATMDPEKLAESAVDLNLKLMRWRLVPSLDLDKIRGVRCLLLGSGTLGCNVARCLLGWGVRTITFVDNGKVSYSNPVRQTLFVFDDCLDGGGPKAERAAEALKKIYPRVNATGVTLSVPMPGHFVTESMEEQVREDVKVLEDLIEAHDVVYLLMDTRESRWLPTVIAAVKRKLVITAALGFDTFLAMRHGMVRDVDGLASGGTAVRGNMLGCYFCNDVVAPGDSTRNRTMDQQCTVTRPGLSMMAASTAVELMVSVVQHPDGALAAADPGIHDGSDWSESQTALGIVPHQVRCFLSRFSYILPVSRAFDRCTACSSTVLDGYAREGFAFLLNAFNAPTFLEDITGLTLLHQETQSSEVWELSDDE